jgi:CHAT domain-containing protein
MTPKILLLLAALICGYTPFADPDQPVARVLALYHRADHYFRLTNNTPATDSAAVADYDAVIKMLPGLPDFKEKDTVLAHSWLNKGILLDGDGDYFRAVAAYKKMMDLHPQQDSLAFVAMVFAGGAYYNLNNFDSAVYYLRKADGIPSAYRNEDSQVRLYNTLGVLYHDNGNYQLGVNYFNRALRVLESKRPLDTISAVNLQTNIATSFYRLGQYGEALALYKKILGYRLNTFFIYQNMGRTYTALERYPEALNAFRKVDLNKVPGALNEMAYAQLQLHRADSSEWYLDRFQAMSVKGKVNPLDIGINRQYRADLLADQQQYKAALDELQQAIILFSRGFGNTDILSNPSSFTGAFAYFRLFDALLKKARTLELLYKSDPKESWLRASYQAYSAALSLLRYIEKSYDSDEAKLFLKKKSARAYDGALTVCLQLHRLHPDGAWLEQAFLISEKSKATVIFANLQENAFMTGLSGADEQAMKEVRNLKYNIARLDVQSEEGMDSARMATIDRQRGEYGIRLSRLQKQLEQNNAYYKLKYEDEGPGLKDLQQQLTGDQALVSYYAAAGTLHSFVLTHNSIRYASDDSIASLQQDVESWLGMLKVVESGRRFKPGEVGERLYRRLVKPVQDAAQGKSEWIIVPDGFLYYLPFESLPGGGDNDYVLRTETISYRWSSRMLSAPGAGADGTGILSFAPFVHKAGTAGFAQLPASGDEVAGLQGAQYIDTGATKSNFLRTVNHWPIIHLATHAVSSPTRTSGSYVAFYPAAARADDNNLYLEELYGLNLSATRLVIISACETGQGQLAGKEGVISLSRAFAYAGCASTINSLWKADDRATAYILRRFYAHLQRGLSKAKALQEAKLDYLSGDAIDKSPAYWAHLVLMGDESPLYAATNWWIRGGAGVLVLLGVVVVVRRKKSTVFNRR